MVEAQAGCNVQCSVVNADTSAGFGPVGSASCVHLMLPRQPRVHRLFGRLVVSAVEPLPSVLKPDRGLLVDQDHPGCRRPSVPNGGRSGQLEGGGVDSVRTARQRTLRAVPAEGVSEVSPSWVS